MYLKRRVHTVASAEAICHEDRSECGTVQVGMRWQAYGKRRAIISQLRGFEGAISRPKEASGTM